MKVEEEIIAVRNACSTIVSFGTRVGRAMAMIISDESLFQKLFSKIVEEAEPPPAERDEGEAARGPSRKRPRQ